MHLSVTGKTRPSFSVFKSMPFDENQSKVSQGPNLADRGPKSSFEPLGYPCVCVCVCVCKCVFVCACVCKCVFV